MDADGTITKTYGYEPNSLWTANPLFQKIGDGYYWYHNDHLGTPHRIVDSSGNVVWSAMYEPFGKATIMTETIGNNFRFPGQYWDGDTGLHYNCWRYQDPGSGRYLQSDPIRNNDNWYLYGGNNPITRMDPLGLHDWPYAHSHAPFDHPSKQADAETKWGLFGSHTIFYPHYKTRPEIVQEMIDKHEQYHHEVDRTDEEGAYRDEIENIDDKLKELDSWDPRREDLEALRREIESRLGGCPK